MSISTIPGPIEPTTASNRRQPIRQTRTNPTRNVSNARGLGAAQQEATKPDVAPGFFPGILHFTDSITALPKEMIRHYTMLKEVDAKLYHPEEALKRFVSEALRRPPPVPTVAIQNALNQSLDTEGAGSGAIDPKSLDQLFDRQHRELHLQLRIVANNMLGTLDEKNHVIGNATDELEKLIARCESSWTAIEGEISEITRTGNPDHWAYTSNTSTEKKASASETRPRREVAHNNNISALAHGGDIESRYDGRTVQGSRKHRLNQNDSDFDEPRGGKRTVAGKGKRAEYTSTPAVTGLGITNGTSNKKRKIEKPTPTVGGHAMDRSASSLYGNSTRGAASPRDTPAAESSKKRNRASAATLGAALGGRKRAGTANSATNSPHLVSSPVAHTSNPVQKPANSPAIGAAMQRSSSTRARQNSTNNTQPAKVTQATTKDTNSNGVSATPEQANGAKNADSKVSKAEDTSNTDLATRSSGRAAERSTVKREDSATTRHRPPAITTGTRNNGKTSKTGTPVAPTFTEPARPRSGRNNTTPALNADPPPKRSHKKGAGINAQAAAAAAKAAAEAARAAVEDEGSDIGDDDEPADGEPLYCYCERVSFGEMIGCDGEKCKREWFHLGCVGLERPPAKNETWFCRECAPLAAKNSKR